MKDMNWKERCGFALGLLAIAALAGMAVMAEVWILNAGCVQIEKWTESGGAWRIAAKSGWYTFWVLQTLFLGTSVANYMDNLGESETKEEETGD